jgi:hypothetical protein
MNTALALLLGCVLLGLVGRSIFRVYKSLPSEMSEAERRVAWLVLLSLRSSLES